MSTVETSGLLRATGEHDEVKYAAFVARETKATMKLRDRGHRDFKNLSDADCVRCAEKYCAVRRSTYRIRVKV